MKNKIVSQISTECPWRDTLYWYNVVDSTNIQAKALAKAGAPHGSVLIAGSQTSGRGRMGRSFLSPTGGVYLSVILRPACPPDKLMHLTCAAAVAGCKAVNDACGVCPNIKWTNDLVWGKQKLGGILTELVLDSKGIAECAIIGIGINCEKTEAFPAELQEIVISVQDISPTGCTAAKLAAKLVEALYEMDTMLFAAKQEIMDTYRMHCITLGKEIQVSSGNHIQNGTALDLDEDGGLLVQFTDGSKRIVASGEVSVRGMYGYL